MIVSQYAKQTIDGSQLTVYFSADFDGVDPGDITSITATFTDSEGAELFQYDVTGEETVTIAVEKDQSIQSVITYATATNEYQGIANYAITRYATKKRSDLAQINKTNRTQLITDLLATVEPMVRNAVFVHSTGERLQFDQYMDDINKQLDYYLPC